MLKRLLASKTFWAAIAIIVTTIGAGMTGEMAWLEVAKIVVGSVLTIFMRDAIAGRGPGKYPR